MTETVTVTGDGVREGATEREIKTIYIKRR